MLHIAKPFNLVPAPDLIKDYKGSVCIFFNCELFKGGKVWAANVLMFWWAILFCPTIVFLGSSRANSANSSCTFFKSIFHAFVPN